MPRSTAALPRWLWMLAACWAALLPGVGSGGEPRPHNRRRWIDELRRELNENASWVRIHAAEALIEHGHLSEAAAAFAGEVETAEPPYRSGVWRVMARSAEDAEERQSFVERIRRALLDPQGPDRLHAAESLAKLGAADHDDRQAIAAWLADLDDDQAAFPCWLLALSAEENERPGEEAKLAVLLGSADPTARLRAAYALGRLSRLAENTRAELLKHAAAEPEDSPAYVYLLSAALRHARDEVDARNWLDRLKEGLGRFSPGEQFEAATAIGAYGQASDLGLLVELSKSSQADARIGAADGALRILRRMPHRMGAWDWTAISLYLVGMLGVGVYYARQAKTREDYFLGGRAMRPWAVGLSLFATLFSTITYMAWPGEIIKHGPMMLSNLVGLPVAIFIVGWFIIPFIMRLHVTSAYEILEARLGLSVRMLGSVFFLLMRLFWMAVIIYTTATKVLVPVAGLSAAHAPYVSALLGLITVIYTSMGGFKAVVFTDVVQTLILFGGALLTVFAVTAEFGGFGWLPTRWEPGWQAPVLFYDANVRVTLFSGVMSLAVWHICTAGSDQMAIQRYLATRDVKSARRMFTTALAVNMVVGLFLGALGLALFAYFRARPEMMNLGQSAATHADQFFPQFVVFALPEGISGLVVAGLLAAAMSSLSSGVSSSSSVITVDFLERFGRHAANESGAGTARIVSWLIGAAVVVLSTGVGMVEGNLLEVTYKLVNLLTAPLFGLFFMAMFVRSATPFGTWVGAVAGVATIVLVNFWKELTGQPGISFMWGMPLSLSVQIAAGCLASLLPVGAARPMLAADGLDEGVLVAEEGAAL